METIKASEETTLVQQTDDVVVHLRHDAGTVRFDAGEWARCHITGDILGYGRLFYGTGGPAGVQRAGKAEMVFEIPFHSVQFIGYPDTEPEPQPLKVAGSPPDSDFVDHYVKAEGSA